MARNPHAVSLFSQPVQTRRPISLKPVTLRDFSGGWDATDDDEILNLKYASVLQNMQVGTDGSVGLRFGSFRFNDFSSVVTGTAINVTYFALYLVVVTSTGQMCKIDGNGVATAIWNTAIANALPGAPSGWNATTQAIFVPFKQNLIVHNGVNKPVTIDQNLVVKYLQDPVSGSSVLVPVGSLACAVANYHVVAGIPASPTVVYVSATAAPGTFPGDAAPNDSISFDVGAYTSISTAEIRGVAGFKNWLMIFFRDSTLIVTLGQYKTVGTASIHTPEFSDTLAKIGLYSQRAITYVDNDVYFAAPTGIYSAQRNLFANQIESKPLSSIIDPGYYKISRILTQSQEVLSTFNVYSVLDKTLYCFMNGPAVAYTFSSELRIKGWSLATGWNWTCACMSRQGRVFFGTGTKIYQLGNNVFPGEEYYSDKRNDYTKLYTVGMSVVSGDKVFDKGVTNRMWVALVSHTMDSAYSMLDNTVLHPERWSEDLGVPISIDWELPWLDFKVPEQLKHIRTVKIGSKGTGMFNILAYVDGLYKDEKGNVIHQPALSMDMVGGSFQGWGGSPGQLYGGGRKSNDPRLYKFPVKFKRVKIRITGNLVNKLRIVWITFQLLRGSSQRG